MRTSSSYIQAHGRPAYDPTLAAFVPGAAFQHESSAGAARDSFALQVCLAAGFAARPAAAAAPGFAAEKIGAAPSARQDDDPTPIRACWDTIFREARSVRQSVGMVDVSTLGKVDLQEPDVAEFLNSI